MKAQFLHWPNFLGFVCILGNYLARGGTAVPPNFSLDVLDKWEYTVSIKGESMNTQELSKLKKGDSCISVHLGPPVKVTLLESPRQGRGWKSTILVDVFASAIGLYDEAGSVYVKDLRPGSAS